MSELIQTVPETTEYPILIRGEPLLEMPQDLYIPPDALEVFLETFSGPLDLLLYLIKKQNIDILDIPIAEITRQYVAYIDLMQNLKIELAAEYLVMAAMLAEIKSRLLLPSLPNEQGEEEDPRAELIKRLVEYEQFKLAAENLDQIPREERDFVTARPIECAKNWAKPEPAVDMAMLLKALADVMEREAWRTHHAVRLESLTLRERMTEVLEVLSNQEICEFAALFRAEEGRIGLVVTFIAILELARQSMLELVQSEALGNIYVKRFSSEDPHG